MIWEILLQFIGGIVEFSLWRSKIRLHEFYAPIRTSIIDELIYFFIIILLSTLITSVNDDSSSSKRFNPCFFRFFYDFHWFGIWIIGNNKWTLKILRKDSEIKLLIVCKLLLLQEVRSIVPFSLIGLSKHWMKTII